ncbi:GtrA family protein [Neisseria polysaccharea]|uniref:GtrA family protein n=1 Tax=Neisseria polysaccharea TaxID=489 RepID=UPI002729EEE1|nr:GtrA family protein [Neisseria polysaccharea]
MRLKRFARYGMVGIINTLIHIAVFTALSSRQYPAAAANLIAFAAASAFGFAANARWTFGTKASFKRYACFVLFMGFAASASGLASDALAMPPQVAAVGFSAISLIYGYLCSSYLVFAQTKGKP